MEKPYFVMLYNQSGDRLVPMLEDTGELAMYASAAEARADADANPMGKAFGYIVYSANTFGSTPPPFFKSSGL